MAITWNTYWTNPATGHYERHTMLYDAYDTAGGTTNGEWFSCAGVDNVLVEFDESNTAGITISGSNAATVPANSAHGLIIGSEITSDAWTEIEAKDLPRWLKVRITTATSGTVTVGVKTRGRGLGNSSE